MCYAEVGLEKGSDNLYGKREVHDERTASERDGPGYPYQGWMGPRLAELVAVRGGCVVIRLRRAGGLLVSERARVPLHPRYCIQHRGDEISLGVQKLSRPLHILPILHFQRPPCPNYAPVASHPARSQAALEEIDRAMREWAQRGV